MIQNTVSSYRKKIGGLGVKSFTQQYLCALVRDTEVYISNNGSFPTHSLVASIEAATQQTLWLLLQDGKIKETMQVYNKINKKLNEVSFG